MTTSEVIALEQRAQQWLGENARSSMQKEGVSASIMFSHIGKRNIRTMLMGITIALISLILVVALRSIKMGLVSLVPNLVPTAMRLIPWG